MNTSHQMHLRYQEFFRTNVYRYLRSRRGIPFHPIVHDANGHQEEPDVTAKHLLRLIPQVLDAF